MRLIVFALALGVVANLQLFEPLKAQVLAPSSERFAKSDLKETPDFQKHVAPLLGRLGCNGRSCHGSFQGRGGFRLSLFGYDFKMDHEALLAKSSAEQTPRVIKNGSADSLMIRKPSMQVDHQGGQLIELGSWQHHLLKQWIDSGAAGSEKRHELERLELEPSEVVFTTKLQSVKLKVVAVWEDGSREDVTPLCRFRSNDDSSVAIDDDGMLTATGRGDTHVIAFYDNGVGAVPVLRAFSDHVEPLNPEPTNKVSIDSFIEAKLTKLGIQPSRLCTDTEFLRRVSIDLTGTLPTPSEVQEFVADPFDGKRKRKIGELLSRPAYAAWWTNRLCDYTGCNPNQQAELGQETSVQWFTWINKRLQDNMPYDEFVERIVLAQSRGDGQAYDDYASSTTAHYRDETGEAFSQRQTMPHYWSRRSQTKSEDKALAFAHSFLGIRLMCAQCHKHPFAPWTQSDFQQFSKFFDNVKFGVVPETDKRYRELARQVGLNVRGKNGSSVRKDVLRRLKPGQTIPWREVHITKRSEPITLSLLRSRKITLTGGGDPRAAIMRWMKQPDNPWFARAFVNRVWAGYFHVGIIEPPDDLNPANPPSHPKLLDWLTHGFVKSGYDMKWLHREIVSSKAYQRSWKPNSTNRDDRGNFSRAIPRRLPAEVIYDIVKQAVAGSDKQEEVRTDLTRRAIGHLSMRLAGTYAMHVFGKPERAVNCDCERVSKPTLLAAIFLQNDPLVEQRLVESGWLQEIGTKEQAGGKSDPSNLIRTAWLRTVNRLPREDEQSRAAKHLANAASQTDGMRDILWALINTKEFILN